MLSLGEGHEWQEVSVSIVLLVRVKRGELSAKVVSYRAVAIVLFRNIRPLYEGNVLFNGALNTFYLQLYGIVLLVRVKRIELSALGQLL